MKLMQSRKLTRTVEYFGYSIDMPLGHRWLAADSDGRVYSYATRPMKCSPYDFCGNGDLAYVADFELGGTPWQETRMEYPL
jgi:hypothetical protein